MQMGKGVANISVCEIQLEAVGVVRGGGVDSNYPLPHCLPTPVRKGL